MEELTIARNFSRDMSSSARCSFECMAMLEPLTPLFDSARLRFDFMRHLLKALCGDGERTVLPWCFHRSATSMSFSLGCKRE